MKFIVTEKQFKVLKEQATDFEKRELEKISKFSDKIEKTYQPVIDFYKKHPDLSKVLIAFIPAIGPYISMGLMGMEMKQAYDNSTTNEEKKNVILSYVISMALAWGLGKVFKSMAELGEEGMKMLSRKMRTIHGWKTLSTKESAVILDLANSPQKWQEKLKSMPKK